MKFLQDDIYFHISSYKMRRSDSELEREFKALDSDSDGMIGTGLASEDFKIPIDQVDTYWNLSLSKD